MGFSASERVSLADCIRDSFHSDLDKYLNSMSVSILLEDKATVPFFHSDMKAESKREKDIQPMEMSGLSMANLLAFFHP